MAQKKKTKKQPPKKGKRRINRSQKIMVIIGVFIVLSMLVGPIISLLGN